MSVEHQRRITPLLKAAQITPLLKTALTATAGKQLVVLLAEVPPDETGVGHYHPGDEVIYVLEGSVTFTVDGQPEVTLQAGETCHIPAKHVHFGKTGSNGLKFLSYPSGGDWDAAAHSCSGRNGQDWLMSATA